jgi:hypothetical protein
MSSPLTIFVRDVLEKADLLEDDPARHLDAREVNELADDVTAFVTLALRLMAQVVSRGEVLHLPRESGTRSTTVWLARRTRTTTAEARNHVRLAEAMNRHPRIAEAVRTGALHPEQAIALGAVLRSLEAPTEVLDRFVGALVERSADSNATALREAAPGILATIAPDLATARAEADERRSADRARRSKRLTMSDDGTGRTHGRFVLPTPQAATLREILTALAGADGGSGELGPDRLGQAFAELIDRHPVRPLTGSPRKKPRSGSGRAGKVLDAMDRFRHGGPPGPVPA